MLFCYNFITKSPQSDSNQRPADYKSAALANWAMEATKGTKIAEPADFAKPIRQKLTDVLQRVQLCFQLIYFLLRLRDSLFKVGL